MNIFRRIMRIFNRKTKKLPKPMECTIEPNDKDREEYLQSLKVKSMPEKKQKRGIIKGIFCEGDGTGICKYDE